MSAPSRVSLFKAMAARQKANAGPERNARPLRGIFSQMGSSSSAAPAPQQERDDAEGDGPRGKASTLTVDLIEKQVARHQQKHLDSQQKKVRKRRYNNTRRARQKKQRVVSKDVGKSRGSHARVAGLVSGICLCSLEVCFSQFQPILASLVALLSLFAAQCKAVRDEILQECVGQDDVCVLGFKLCLKCFRRLFQLGKAQLSRFSQGKVVVDRRMKGQARLERASLQEAKVRAYLVTVYTRFLNYVEYYVFLFVFLASNDIQ